MKHYICNHKTGSFDFYADNKLLALDHAKHHCAVMGFDFLGIAKVEE